MNFHLQQSNALFKTKVCFYVLLDDDINFLQCNDNFRETFHSPGILKEIFTPADYQRFLLLITNAKQHPGDNTSAQLQVLQPGGQPIDINWEVSYFNDDKTSYLECLGVPVKSLEAKNNAKNEKHEQGNGVFTGHPEEGTNVNVSAEEQYKLIFFKNPLPMWIYEIETLRFAEVNEAAVAKYGYTKEEFYNMTIADIRPNTEIKRFSELQQTDKKYNQIHTGHWKHLKKNGEILDVQITAHLLTFNGKQAKLVLANDITEQVEAEENLIKSNERYTYASKATFDAIWDWDFETDQLFYGEGFKMLFGYELTGNQGNISTWLDHIHPDDIEKIKVGLNRAIKYGLKSWMDEYRYVKADGNYASVVHRGIILRNDEGVGVRMIGAMQDISNQKRNEQQLQKINLQLLRQQKERELTASILRSLSEKELLDEALEDILRKLTLFFNLELGEIWFLDRNLTRLELRQKWFGNKAMEQFYETHQRITIKVSDQNALGKSWKGGEIFFIDDLCNNEYFIRKEGAKKAGLVNSLGVPIIFKGQTIAMFSFFGIKEFTEKEKIKSYFEALSLQLGIDIKRKKTEEELNRFFELSPDILSIVGFDGSFKKVNADFGKILGFTREEMLTMNFDKLVVPEDLAITKERFRKLEKEDTVQYFENRFRTKQGSYRWLAWASTPIVRERVIYATGKDITEKKLLDEKINRILESISDGFFSIDKNSIILYWNRRAEQILNLKREEIVGKNIYEKFKNIVSKRFIAEYKNALESDVPAHFEEYVPGLNTWFEISAYPYEGILSVFFKDVTERKKTEETIRMSGERYEVLAKATKDTIWDWNLVKDEVIWNEGLKNNFNYTNVAEASSPEWWLNNLHPDDRERVESKIKKHIEDRETHWEDEYRFRCHDGNYKYIYDRGFTIYNDLNLPTRMIGSMQDLTETKANEVKLKELNESLELRAAQLATSNAELERFAYVASHDLQEPLRMVSSFLQLIEKKYKDRLDQKGHEYIGFAVDGAERMKGLILDLLEYSRVNSRKETKEEVDLNETAANLLLTYQAVIKKENGEIHIGNLPVVQGNKLQLMQLFQNLISNALKYKSSLPPKIEIGCNENDEAYEFYVSDNGIGIEERFFKKIFVIFQRLHNKNEYSGTGIGLAICKKIVDLHEGKIWVQSKPGQGSTFHFTLPKGVEEDENGKKEMEFNSQAYSENGK